MEIGTKLRDSRKNIGLTQEQVSESIHVSRQTISNWETNKTFPDIMSVILLSDLYEVSLDYLLKGDKQMNEYIKDSTDHVTQTKHLIATLALYILLVTLFIVLTLLSVITPSLIIGAMCLLLTLSGYIMYRLIAYI